ncbi:MAG: M1 family aminopeptidase, partial [Ignavibacteriaceae bacterium]|nr:M1 family aminopeptidase [Ignavibacteriaceae bacterium]
TDHLIKVPVDPPLPVGSFITATIYYFGNGEETVVSGYNGIRTGSAYNSSVTCTFSEPFWSKIWWPCKQILTDKADSVQIFITTESDCKAGSNGILKSVISIPGDKVRYEWKSNYPIAYYLISFAVGQYIEDITYMTIKGSTDSIMIQSYLFQDCPFLSMQMVAIEKTKDFMQLFINLFGDYPFENEKYGYCLYPSSWGAMEHQTMTTIGYQALDTTAAYIGSYYYFWYSAHELGHSWFGDNVTCATWQDIWINEGFAGYSEYLALQYLESQVRADFWMSDAHQKIKLMPGGSVYVPYEYINDESRIFDYRLTYKKGAALVHMLRFEVGNDSLFFLTLKNFQNEFKDSVATGFDFKDVLETTTGQDFTDFFNQWYFGEGYPIYNISWTQVNDTLKIHSVQSTSTSVTPLFKMHLEIKLNFSGGDTLITLYQNSNDQFFKIYFSQLITNISVDPNNWVVDFSNIIHTEIEDDQPKIESFYLSQNFPNPFNSITTIKYDVPEKNRVMLKIYNVLGKELVTLIDEEKAAGNYEIKFESKGFSSGIYFYKMQAGNFEESKKMILLR